MKSLEEGIEKANDIMKRSYSYACHNAGKIIAIITGVLAVLLTFTDISIPEIVTESLCTELIVMIIASYIIYFSLEDAGEALGRGTEEYKNLLSGYENLVSRISGDMIAPLREYLIRVADDELRYRRRTALISAGLCEDDMLKLEGGEPLPKEERRALMRIAKMKPRVICVHTLLGESRTATDDSLKNPERGKLLALFLKLIPSTLCMLLTVSMIISAKEGMDMASIISGIVKLSTLPLIGLRGYSQGYTYITERKSEWIRTKTKLLSAFLAEQNSN